MIIRTANRVLTIIILAGALLGAQAVTAQQPPAPRTGGPNRAAMGPPGAGQNNSPDTPGTGAYPAMKEEIPALSRHVVYRPANLAAMGPQKLGVVAWGNGGCSDDAARLRIHQANNNEEDYENYRHCWKSERSEKLYTQTG